MASTGGPLGRGAHRKSRTEKRRKLCVERLPWCLPHRVGFSADCTTLPSQGGLPPPLLTPRLALTCCVHGRTCTPGYGTSKPGLDGRHGWAVTPCNALSWTPVATCAKPKLPCGDAEWGDPALGRPPTPADLHLVASLAPSQAGFDPPAFRTSSLPTGSEGPSDNLPSREEESSL